MLYYDYLIQILALYIISKVLTALSRDVFVYKDLIRQKVMIFRLLEAKADVFSYHAG
jgi:hypothetical protein